MKVMGPVYLWRLNQVFFVPYTRGGPTIVHGAVKTKPTVNPVVTFFQKSRAEKVHGTLPYPVSGAVL